MSTAVRSDSHSAAVDESFVVFTVGGGDYAIATGSVDEVLRMVALTPLPDAPTWLSGAMNLRGRVIPVIDLRVRLGFTAPPVGLSTPILVASEGDVKVGLIADAVDGMVSIPTADVAWHHAAEGQSFVRGIARRDGRLVFVVDLGRVCEGVVAFVPHLA